MRTFIFALKVLLIGLALGIFLLIAEGLLKAAIEYITGYKVIDIEDLPPPEPGSGGLILVIFVIAPFVLYISLPVLFGSSRMRKVRKTKSATMQRLKDLNVRGRIVISHEGDASAILTTTDSFANELHRSRQHARPEDPASKKDILLFKAQNNRISETPIDVDSRQVYLLLELRTLTKTKYVFWKFMHAMFSEVKVPLLTPTITGMALVITSLIEREASTQLKEFAAAYVASGPKKILRVSRVFLMVGSSGKAEELVIHYIGRKSDLDRDVYDALRYQSASKGMTVGFRLSLPNIG